MGYKNDKWFSDKRVNIREYGVRFESNGHSFFCGDHKPYNYLKFPEYPFLKHSASKLLWAIELASTILQDRPTRKQTRDICRISTPLFSKSKYQPSKVNNDGYWRDLYRRGYINQYRRSYGKGSNRHFDIVYELSESGQNYLRVARENELAVERAGTFI